MVSGVNCCRTVSRIPLMPLSLWKVCLKVAQRYASEIRAIRGVTSLAERNRTLSANRVSTPTAALVLAKYETSRILRLKTSSGDSPDGRHAHSLQLRARDTPRALAERSPDGPRHTSCAQTQAGDRLHDGTQDSSGHGRKRTCCTG